MEPYEDEEGESPQLHVPTIVITQPNTVTSPHQHRHKKELPDIEFQILSDNFANSGVQQILCILTLTNSYTVTWLSNDPNIHEYPDHRADWIVQPSRTDPDLGLIYRKDPYRLEFVFLKRLKRFVPPRTVFATPRHFIVKERIVSSGESQESTGDYDDHAFELRYIEHCLKKKRFTSSFDHFLSLFKSNEQLRAMNDKLMKTMKEHMQESRSLESLLQKISNQQSSKSHSVQQIADLKQTLHVMSLNHKLELDKKDDELITLEESLADTQRQLINVRSEKEAIEKEVEFLRSNVKTQIDDVQNVAKSQTVQYRMRVIELTERLENIREIVASEFKKDLEKERARFDAQIDAIEARHAEALLAEREDLKKNLLSQKKELIESFENEKIKLAVASQRAQSTLIQKFESEMATQKKLWEVERHRFHAMLDDLHRSKKP